MGRGSKQKGKDRRGKKREVKEIGRWDEAQSGKGGGTGKWEGRIGDVRGSEVKE